MNEHPNWTRRVKALLDESAQDLDATTLSRLNRARQAAIASRRPRAATWFLPAGLASACVLLLAVAVWHGHAPRPTGATRADAQTDSIANDADALADDDDFYEDLDFYAWLDAQEPDPEH
jgi:hypothetical protein